MANKELLESLNIEENVFELNEDTMVKFLVWMAAPGTGSSEIVFPKGTRFKLLGPMRDDAMYLTPINLDDDFYARVTEQEKKHYPEVANRIQGYSFFITEEQLGSWDLNFIGGSKERIFEIFQIIRNSNAR